MRPITPTEFQRMRMQAESRMASQTMISLNMRAKFAETNNNWTYWKEEGYICDFKYAGSSVRTNDHPGFWTGLETQYFDEINGEVTMPIRYLDSSSPAFTVQSDDPGAAGWQGARFSILPQEFGVTDDSMTIPPHVLSFSITNFGDGYKTQISDFEVTSVPILHPDSFSLVCYGRVQVEVTSIYDHFTGAGNKHNYAQVVFGAGPYAIMGGTILIYSNPGDGGKLPRRT